MKTYHAWKSFIETLSPSRSRRLRRQQAGRTERRPQLSVENLEPRMVLSGTPPTLGDVIINEYSSEVDDEFIELLVLGDGIDLRGLIITDNNWTGSSFNTNEGSITLDPSAAYLSDLPAGTLITIYTDGSATAADTTLDPANGDWSLSLSVAAGLTRTGSPNLATGGDGIYVLSGSISASTITPTTFLDFLTYENPSGNTPPPGFDELELGSSADNGYFFGTTAAESNNSLFWFTSTDPVGFVTPGEANPGQDLSGLRTSSGGGNGSGITGTFSAVPAASLAAVPEGFDVSLDILYDGADPGEQLTFEITWGDGNTTQEVVTADASGFGFVIAFYLYEVDAQAAYFDGDGFEIGGTIFDIDVSVTDNSGTTELTPAFPGDDQVRIINEVPLFDLTGTPLEFPTISEGQLTQAGGFIFTDPGTGETYRYNVVWGDDLTASGPLVVDVTETNNAVVVAGFAEPGYAIVNRGLAGGLQSGSSLNTPYSPGRVWQSLPADLVGAEYVQFSEANQAVANYEAQVEFDTATIAEVDLYLMVDAASAQPSWITELGFQLLPETAWFTDGTSDVQGQANVYVLRNWDTSQLLTLEDLGTADGLMYSLAVQPSQPADGPVGKRIAGGIVQQNAAGAFTPMRSITSGQGLQNGSLAYSDSTAAWTNLPAELLNAEYLRLASGNNSQAGYELSFTTEQETDIYVLTDARNGTLGEQDWLRSAGFVATELTVGLDESGDGTVDQTAFVWVRRGVASGETITLGAQNNGNAMYGVALKLAKDVPNLVSNVSQNLGGANPSNYEFEIVRQTEGGLQNTLPAYSDQTWTWTDLDVPREYGGEYIRLANAAKDLANYELTLEFNEPTDVAVWVEQGLTPAWLTELGFELQTTADDTTPAFQGGIDTTGDGTANTQMALWVKGNVLGSITLGAQNGGTAMYGVFVKPAALSGSVGNVTDLPDIEIPAPGGFFISEYNEGASFDKAIELYNNTGGEIDLSQYTLELYSNGASSPSQSMTLSSIQATLAAGETLVITHPSASADLLNRADGTNGAVINFNGDDAVVLRENGTVIDAIGQIGTDPGSRWGSGSITTQDNNLRRIETVNIGDSDANDAFDPSEEWVAFDDADFSNFGTHTVIPDVETIPVAGIQGEFAVGHVYGDSGVFLPVVAVADNSGGQSAVLLSVEVTNTPPAFDETTLPPQLVRPGEEFRLEDIGFTDPAFGGAEVYSYLVDWGDNVGVELGTVEQVRLGRPGVATRGEFDLEYTFFEEGTYTVTVSLDDGEDTAAEDLTFDVIVTSNVAPVANDVQGFVLETASVGQPVVSVPATDANAGQSLSYAITAGNADGRFAIDANTGVISVAGLLNYDITPQYQLEVTVTDNGNPPLSTTANVTINVLENSTVDADDDFYEVTEDTTLSVGVGGQSFEIVFQQGAEITVGGIGTGTTYSGTVDRSIRSNGQYSATDAASLIDGDVNGAEVEHLLRFEDLFGDGTGQIPLGSTITSAELNLEIWDDGDPVDIHQILGGWDVDTVTYQNFQLNGNTQGGIQGDGTEATAPLAELPNRVGGTYAVDLTSSLQAWSDGEPNHGWGFVMPVGGNGVQWRSSNFNPNPAERPRLVVTFTPPADDASVLNNDAGDGLTAEVLTEPSNGTVAFNPNGTFTYTPNQDFNGLDSFTYQVTDLRGDTATATVRVNVAPVADPPVLEDAAFEVTENAATGTTFGQVTAFDPDLPESLSYAITGGNVDLDNDGLAAFAIDSGNGTITVADADEIDFESLSEYILAVTVTDSENTTDTALVTISVTDVDEAPVTANDFYSVDNTAVLEVTDGTPPTFTLVFREGAEITVNGQGTGVIYEGTRDVNIRENQSISPDLTTAGIDSDLNLDTLLWFSGIIGSGIGQIPQGATITDADLTLSLTDDGDFVNIHRVLGQWDENTVTWNDFQFNGNMQPGVQGDDLEATPPVGQTPNREAGIQQIDVTSSLEAWVSGSPNFGWAFVGRPGFGNGTTWSSSEFDIEMNRPTLTVSFTAPSGGAGVLLNDVDPEGESLTAELLAGPTNGSVQFNTDGTFQYTPNLGFVGTDTFTYEAIDPAGNRTPATVTIEVTGETIPPLDADDDFYETAEDTPLAVGVLPPPQTIVFQEGAEITINGVSTGIIYTGTEDTDMPSGSGSTRPSGGSLNVDSSGLIHALTQFQNIFGTEPGQIPPGSTISDAELELQITNPGSTLQMHRVLGAWSEQTVTWNNFQLNGNTQGGVQGDGVEATAVLRTIAGSTGRRSIDVTADLALWADDPSSNYGWALTPTGTDGVDWLSSENGNLSQRPSLVVTFTPPVPPGSVFDNDTGGSLTASLVSGPSNGSLDFNPNGTFLYTPNANFNGLDSFTYEVNDVFGDTQQAVVRINVTSVNDLPTLSNATFSVPENSPAGTNVGTMTGADDDLIESLSYAITGGNVDVDGDGIAAFAIDSGSGQITVQDADDLDFEQRTQFQLAIQVTDLAGATAAATATINVTNVNESPVVIDDVYTIAEDSTLNAFSYTVELQEGRNIIINGFDTGVVYNGTQDTDLPVNGDTPRGNNANINVDSSALVQALTRFDNLFGSGTGQIPTGGQILSGTLQLTIFDTGSTMNFHRVLGDWNEDTATYNNFQLNGNTQGGIQGDGVEATEVLQQVNGSAGVRQIDVTDDLRTWLANPSTNFGWAFTPTGSNGVDWRTSESSNPADRPKLTFTYVPPQSAGGSLQELILQEGAEITVNGAGIGQTYSGTDDADMPSGGDTPRPNNTSLNVDGQGPLAHGVIRFRDVFGTNPGQIPPTAAIDGATLTLDVTNPGDTIRMLRLLGDWSEDTATWNNFQLNGNTEGGLQADGLEAIDVRTFPGGTGNREIDVTEDLLAWLQDPTQNFGWGFINTGGNGIDWSSSENGTVSDRPQLAIRYRVPPQTPGAGLNDSDPEGDPLTYAVISGPTSGTLTLENDGNFVYTPDTNYAGQDQFTYQVDDGNGLTETATVTINVVAVNDAPIVQDATFSVDEDASVGTLAGAVNAFDIEDGQNITYAITSGNVGDAFAIDETTGLITVAGGLDFETTSSYTLEVEVTDSSDPAASSTAQITIDLNDINDAPTLDNAAGSVAEDASPGTTVLTIQGSDADAGQSLSYAITGGNVGGVFDINASTGEITVVGPLNFETLSQYQLAVTATDNGSPALSDSATVTINITDVNDAPVLDDVAVTIGDDLSVGSLVVDLMATDEDAGQMLTYAISSGNSAGDFVIDPATGEIRVAQELDGGVTPQYTLQVTVTDDGSPVAVTTATVTINVLVINADPVVGSLLPATADEGSLVTFTATAADEESPADQLQYQFSFDGGQTFSPLSSANTIERQLLDDGILDVVVRVTDPDGGVGERTFQVTVDNLAPTASINLPVLEPIFANEVTLTATASDPANFDGTERDPLSYSWEVFGPENSGSTPDFTGSSSAEFRFTPAEIGTYRVVLTVTDGDGGQTVVTEDLVVGDGVPDDSGLAQDPWGQPGEQALFVLGSDRSDVVYITQDGEEVTVFLNFRNIGTYTPDTRIFVFTYDGNDRVQLDSRVTYDTIVNGGAGNDSITTAGGNDLVIGSSGNDIINTGNFGNDIVIGGTGRDNVRATSQLMSANDDDLLIGDSTIYDDNLAALAEIYRAWNTTTDSDAERTAVIDELRTGLPSGRALNDTTVIDDNSADSLTGLGGFDWALLGIGDRNSSSNGLEDDISD